MADRLIDELQKIDRFSEEEIDTVLGFLVKKFIPKGEHFLNPDQVSGDVSYKHHQILDNQFGGSNIDYVQSQKTYDHILNYAKKNPLIYLPSHDENSANRLTRGEYLINNNYIGIRKPQRDTSADQQNTISR